MKIVKKGWGYEKWIVNKPDYCGKLLFFEKNKKCSWHYHNIKDETFYVHSGLLLVRFSNFDQISKASETILEPGDSFYVYKGLRHQMLGIEETYMYEFSTEHFDSDSIRIIKGD